MSQDKDSSGSTDNGSDAAQEHPGTAHTDVQSTNNRDASPNDDLDIHLTSEIANQIKAALELLSFAIETGLKTSDNQKVPSDIIKTINVTAAKVGLFDQEASTVSIKASDWVRFDAAYYALADFTRPVTIETLRNTATTGHGFGLASPAQRFTWLLWAITILFVLAAVGSTFLTQRFVDSSVWLLVGQMLTPWAYGGLGACANLLRSAHSFMYQRCFDIRRKPEYLNRILLGAVSGGAIILLINQVISDAGSGIRLGANALGFVAGYSNDFLFNTIERVVAALLPKAGIDTVQQAPPSSRPSIHFPAAGITLKELIDKMENATSDNKELYRALIEKLRERL